MENENNLPKTPSTIQLRPYFMVLMILCAYLFVRGIVFADAGISVLVCAVVFSISCLYFFHSIRGPIPRSSYPYLAAILLVAIACALFENTGIKWLLFLGLLLILPYWLLIMAGKRTGSSLSGHAVGDVLYVERYGYTLLRLHTTCFMGMLFIAFCVLIVCCISCGVVACAGVRARTGRSELAERYIVCVQRHSGGPDGNVCVYKDD